MRPFLIAAILFAFAVCLVPSAQAHGPNFSRFGNRGLSDFERGVIAGQQSRGHFGANNFGGYGSRSFGFSNRNFGNRGFGGYGSRSSRGFSFSF